jgi:hypothetical protein
MSWKLVKFHSVFVFLSLILTNIAWSEELTKPARSMTGLSDNDHRILENGEIRGFRRAAGTILAVYPGFGIGHAVHGRYLHRGWIFTLGELGSAAVIATSLSGCESATGGCFPALIGFSGFIGFKVWEFVDSIVGPIRDNRQYRNLQSRSQISTESGVTILPLPLVKNEGDGQRTAHMGIGLSWSFH